MYMDKKLKLMQVKGLVKVIQLVNGRLQVLRPKDTIHFCVLKGRTVEIREGTTINLTQINKHFHYLRFPLFPHWLV